jgi:rhodanese-related sulfurtransferase
MRAILVAELDAARAFDDRPLVVDVRTAEEYETGHVEGAIHVPAEQIQSAAESLRSAGRRIVAVCTRGGHRSQSAASALRSLGMDATWLEGGTLAWQAAHP